MKNVIATAVDTIRAEYWRAVRELAAEVADRVKRGELRSEDAAHEAVYEAVDWHEWVINTNLAMLVPLCSNHEDELVETSGPEAMIRGGAIDWSAIAASSMTADVLARLPVWGTPVSAGEV